MDLGTLLEVAAERHPGHEALVEGPQRWTYAQWRARVNAVAHGFLALGVRRGDRVVFCLKNREPFVTAYFALQKIGAVSAPINFRFAPGEIQYCVNDAEAVALLYEPATREAVSAARPGLTSCTRFVFVGEDPPPDAVPFEALALGRPVEAPAVKVGEEELSLLLYTSGTTGRPKGVPRTHKHYYAGALAHSLQCHYAWGERTLGCMPLYHTMGIHSLLSMVLLNGAFILMSDWDASGALRLIEQERISALYLIPTLYYELVRAPHFDRYDLTAVTKLAFAGAPMTSALTKACLERFRPRIFVNHYGSTEIYTFTTYGRLQERPGCAGRPGIHSRMRIVKADPERRVGPDELVKPGELGEIIASLDSDEAFRGYWRKPEATEKAIRGGWYFTGDMGYQDEEGNFYVTGRVDDMIISGGENIQPVEVEDVLARHPGVLEVAVVGEPDEKWGQIVTAYIVPATAELTPPELDAYCRQAPELVSFKRPRKFVFVRAIPKTASGKILRRLLREGQYEPLP